MHLLASFQRLKKLSLHGNRLAELPRDLSKLKGLETIDISNNFLDDNVIIN
jgi:Leucine-rich repeat (LRR) protein